MPGGDRTGPKGMGPRTGRAAGYCMRFGAPGFSNRSPDFDSRINRDPGRRDRSYQAGGLEERMETLKAQAKQMEKALDGIRQRIRELETGKGEA